MFSKRINYQFHVYKWTYFAKKRRENYTMTQENVSLHEGGVTKERNREPSFGNYIVRSSKCIERAPLEGSSAGLTVFQSVRCATGRRSRGALVRGRTSRHRIYNNVRTAKRDQMRSGEKPQLFHLRHCHEISNQ